MEKEMTIVSFVRGVLKFVAGLIGLTFIWGFATFAGALLLVIPSSVIGFIFFRDMGSLAYAEMVTSWLYLISFVCTGLYALLFMRDFILEMLGLKEAPSPGGAF